MRGGYLRQGASDYSGPEPGPARHLAESLLQNVHERLSRLKAQPAQAVADPAECFKLLAGLGELAFTDWSAARLPDDFTGKLSASVASHKSDLRTVISEGDWLLNCTDQGLARELDRLHANRLATERSLATDLEGIRGGETPPELRMRIAKTSYEVDSYVLRHLDRVAYALAMATDLGILVSNELTQRARSEENAIRSFLARIGPVFEAAEDSLYPMYPELFPASFWWRRRP